MLQKLLALGVLWLLIAQGALAATATVSPSSISANLQSMLPTMLQWTVQVPPALGKAAFVPNTPVTLTSPQASVVTADGRVLQTVSTTLTVRVVPGGQASVAENFTLSPATLAAAARLGAETLLIRRTFSGGLTANGAPGSVATAAASVSLSGSAGGALALARVALHFDDRRLTRVLQAGEAAVAIAEINYTGNGVLNGLWEVASPPSTLGQAVFVPLTSVSVNLGGGGLTEITSPVLPATAAGLYYVRFSVRSPVVPFEGVVIQYAVEAGAQEAPPINVIGPAQHAVLKADTLFRWEAAPGAIAYRLEFFDSDPVREDTRPVSGEWVPAAGRGAQLSVLAQTHLQPGQRYLWRVVATDEKSEVVGRSALFEIRTP